MKVRFQESSENQQQRTTAPAFSRIASSARPVALISSHCDDWNTYLEGVPHDLFHTAQYHRFQEETEFGDAHMAVYGTHDKFVAWPYLLNEIAGSRTMTGQHRRDVTSVYGYSGPLTWGCADDVDFLSNAWRAVVDVWRSQRVVSVFTRFHPLLDNQRWLWRLAGVPDVPAITPGVSQVGQTVAIDLSESPDETWRQYDKHARQAVKRCEQLGLATTFDSEWAYLNDFMRLYNATMSRNSAAPFYFFGSDYFQKLKQATESHSTFVVTTCGDEAASVGLVLEYGGIANLHLLGTDSRFSHISPSKLLVHKTQAWARARGNRYLHLGGGRGSRVDDRLFRFKSRFSRRYYPFYIGRWVLDGPAYDAMSEERLKQAAKLHDGQLDDCFFPAYRAPFCREPADGPDAANSDSGE